MEPVTTYDSKMFGLYTNRFKLFLLQQTGKKLTEAEQICFLSFDFYTPKRLEEKHPNDIDL